MESQKPPGRWGEILIPLVILTSIYVPGMEAMNCGWATCGHGTSCMYGRCHCKPGYAGLIRVPGSNVPFCSKRCQTGKGMCPANTTCKKVYSWRESKACLCSAGAHRSAKGQCLDTDECANKPERCGNNSVCENTVGNYRCTCVEGYRQREGEQVGCNLDIDECNENPGICGNNSVCVNTVGNYTCACAEGYRQRDGEDVGCNEDIDECTENQTICGNNSLCVNTVGNYTCSCAEGYRQKGGEDVGCNLDIDECTENPNTCGNNSVCANTEGNYTCACAEGYKPKEGEELGCSKIVTAAAASTVADSSALTIGLAVGIGGVVLLGVVVLAVVVIFRARNLSSGGIREDIGLEKQGKRSDVIAYENITDQSLQQQRGVTYPTYPVLPDVLGASTQFPSGTDVRYEEVDLPPQAELNNDPQSLYSLVGNFADQKSSESEYKYLYSNHKIADNKAKQLTTEKSQASKISPSESTYNVLSKPHVKPTTATTNTEDNYNTLYGLKPNDESLENIQPGQAGDGNPHRNDDVQYDTTYSAVREIGDNGVQLTSNEQQNGNEYDEIKMQKV